MKTLKLAHTHTLVSLDLEIDHQSLAMHQYRTSLRIRASSDLNQTLSALCVCEMADPLPAAVTRNLSDKLYEKRKNAALEVEGIVKGLVVPGKHERISALIKPLGGDFTNSAQANHRKGGLIGLAAATVGLTLEAAQHLRHIVPPVLRSFCDQDSRVRYYACEALYKLQRL